jgi:hypothetical protein
MNKLGELMPFVPGEWYARQDSKMDSLIDKKGIKKNSLVFPGILRAI